MTRPGVPARMALAAAGYYVAIVCEYVGPLPAGLFATMRIA